MARTPVVGAGVLSRGESARAGCQNIARSRRARNATRPRKVGSSTPPPPALRRARITRRRRSRELEGANMPKHARDDGTTFRIQTPMPGLHRVRTEPPTATTLSTAPAAARFATSPPHGRTAARVGWRRARTRAPRRVSRARRFLVRTRTSADPRYAYIHSPAPSPLRAQTATPRAMNRAGPVPEAHSARRRRSRRATRKRRNDGRNPRCRSTRFPTRSGARTTNASCWRKNAPWPRRR